MAKFRLPTIPEVAAFQKAALAEVIAQMDGKVPFRVEGDGSPYDSSIETVVPSDQYKVITHVKPGSSPVVALLVYIGGYNGSGGYGEWMTYYDDEWHSDEEWTSFPEDARYSLLV